jgi:hypothetical protein
MAAFPKTVGAWAAIGAVLVVMFALAVADAAPPLMAATDASVKSEMKASAVSGVETHQKLQENKTVEAGGDDANDAMPAEDEQGAMPQEDINEGKAGFWKHLMGSSGNALGGVPGSGKKPADKIPSMAYVLPFVGIGGVAVAMTAYFSFAT